ncbi:MAG: phosphotransferase family protein [Actinobacteria bacterium]|nr:phosphotransferase family protein [Actinomycetota bacterium]
MTDVSAGPPQEDLSRPLVDEEALRRYLDERLGEGPAIEVERHQVGHSNETFFLTRGEDRWVLRRPPRGAFLPTAHDVKREYTVLDALKDTPVRTPTPILLCEDTDVIGVPFYVMERVDGVVIRAELPPGFASEVATRRGLGEEVIDALAELHATDHTAVGLEGFGKPTGYLERQLRRWSGQLELTEPFSRRVEELHELTDYLKTNVPESGPAGIVHGDYRLDNATFAPEPPARLLAIFDWEMSTIGDPLADVGWLATSWVEPGDPSDPVFASLAQVTRQEGFPTRAEMVERYQERTGREVRNLAWYMVLAIWKLSILLEGSYARHLAGLTDDPFFASLEIGVPTLARRALDVARGA